MLLQKFIIWLAIINAVVFWLPNGKYAANSPGQRSIRERSQVRSGDDWLNNSGMRAAHAAAKIARAQHIGSAGGNCCRKQCINEISAGE